MSSGEKFVIVWGKIFRGEKAVSLGGARIENRKERGLLICNYCLSIEMMHALVLGSRKRLLSGTSILFLVILERCVSFEL